MEFVFKEHNSIEGTHSFLSPSNYHWINYSDDKLKEVYYKRMAIERGTEDHAFASVCIRRRQRLPRSDKSLNAFVNDAIGYRMVSEQPLYFSENAYGTADAIGFKNGLLRIHDLKTGETPASIRQLEVYTALFCLEYGYKPGDIDVELRIYQSNEIFGSIPEPEDILPIMDKIIRFDKIIRRLKEEGM